MAPLSFLSDTAIDLCFFASSSDSLFLFRNEPNRKPDFFNICEENGRCIFTFFSSSDSFLFGVTGLDLL